jgi:hypothetical protein
VLIVIHAPRPAISELICIDVIVPEYMSYADPTWGIKTNPNTKTKPVFKMQ